MSMNNVTKEEYVHDVFESISSGYDKANNRISLGFQKYWKKMLINRIAKEVPSGQRVLDLCCGTGDIAIACAEKRPDLQVTGADFSVSMLKIARKKGRKLENVKWRKADAMHLPWDDDTFAAATISFGLRNTADYQQVITEMMRVVKKGGCIYCLDSFVPENKLVIPFYRLYFRHIMPVIGGGKKHNREYQWLWQSTQSFLRRKELVDMYSEVGLKNIGSKNRMFGACSMVWGHKADIETK